MMAKRAALAAAFALALTCGPTALPQSQSESPSASVAPIASTDLITLRESDVRQTSLVVRKVATGETVRTMPDGLLMPDGVTLLTVDGGGMSTLVKKIDRRTGATTASRTIDGSWQLYRGFPSFMGTSADGTHVALLGSSYNFTDASGTWTARTTFGILDLATGKIDPIELNGRFAFQALSNDGQVAYLSDYTSLPARPRAYDLTKGALVDVPGDSLPSVDFTQATYVGPFALALFTSTESVQVRPDVVQVTAVAKLARIDLAGRTVRSLRLPVERVPTGEDVFAWFVVPSRDAKSAYVVNPIAGVIHEVDVASLQIRRSATLSDKQSEGGLVDRLLALVHPVADAKLGFFTGAALSPDGSTLYVLGSTGIWSIDVAAFKAKVLTRDGTYETLTVSPDGKRLYVLSRETGIVSAVDAKAGTVLGSMKTTNPVFGIVAVDAG
jgi:DNA-binding beta-propeller fold protein YncE